MMFLIESLLTVALMAAATSQAQPLENSPFVSGRTPKCAEITDGENADHPAPSYVQTLQGSFSLTVEMTMMKKNVTYYVEEVRDRRVLGGEVTDSGAVYLRRNGTETTYHYYPSSGMMVEEQDGQCRETGTEVPPFNPWGWWDHDPSHGDMLYGPSALIRQAYFINKRYLGGNREINGVMCERWMACEGQQSIEIYYYFSQKPWQMAEASFFTEGDGRLPVQFEILFLDDSEHVQYNVLSFVPFVKNPTLTETPRGESCEGLVGVVGGGHVPSVPRHFTFSQEVVRNPQIDGANFAAEQSLRGLQVTYSEGLSLSRLDYMKSKRRLKVIHDFNTGVQYVIDRDTGNCSRTWIPAISFDSNMNVMLGPEELFHLDDSFAFVGQRDTRGSVGDLWTSTRSDLPDPATGGLQNFPKAVLEYYFVKSQEETPEGKEEINVPLRGDVFVYNNSGSSEVVEMRTTNIYDFSVVRLYTEAEFTVEECFDKTNLDWSYLVIAFPASTGSVTDLVMKRIDLFRDQIFSLVSQKGSLSPTRIASIDVSEAPAGEISSSDFVIASVKLQDRVPYIFSYKPMLDEPHPVPGENEKSFEDIKFAEDCAELCSLEKGFHCKSFHHCDDQICFLSSTEESDGKPVITINNCSHWLEFATNRTFVDLPTGQAYEEILQAIRHDEFTVIISDKNSEVQLAATEALLYRSPDPLGPIRGQFNLAAPRTSLRYPEDTVEIMTLEECMTLCVTWRAYRCETIAYQFDDNQCRLTAAHREDLNDTMTIARSQSDLHDRTYLSEYRLVLGGVALNGTGVVIPDVNHPNTCARHCSRATSTPCRSFEWCHEEHLCRLHQEYFLDVADGGDYETHTSCIHFSKAAVDTFSQHPHQGLSKDLHRLVASETDASTCAKLCLDSSEEVCESFDFCSTCGDEDSDVCGDDLAESKDLCFLSTYHVGEAGTVMRSAPHCQHYSREYFGEMDYPTWVASRRRSENPYTSGDMAGLAVGMLLLGVALAAAFLLAIVRISPHSDAHKEEVGVSFLHLKNAVDGESEF